MTKIKKTILLVVLLILATTLFLSLSGKISKAETAQQESSVTKSEEIEPRGILTKLTFSIDGGNGQIVGEVKNKFTLFPATVTVYVYLYNSETYQENYENMMLVSTNYIHDLDQGDTITAIASTNGKQSYWKLRAYYKIDSKAWEEYLSDTVLFNADGIRII